MKKLLLLLITSVMFTNVTFSQTEKIREEKGKFIIKVVVFIDDVNTPGVVMIKKNNESYKIVEPVGTSYPVTLDLNSTYFIKCSVDGYISKTISVDTKLPNGREEDEFAKFTSRINLLKKDGKNKESLEPIGKISYSEAIRDFDVDKNYKKE